MAMIKCSECGKEVSDQAASCPGCGCPIKHPTFSEQQYAPATSEQSVDPFNFSRPETNTGPYCSVSSGGADVKKLNGMANGSLALGVITLLCIVGSYLFNGVEAISGLIFAITGFVSAIAGALLGSKARKKLSQMRQPTGASTAGTIICAVVLVLNILGVVLSIFVPFGSRYVDTSQQAQDVNTVGKMTRALMSVASDPMLAMNNGNPETLTMVWNGDGSYTVQGNTSNDYYDEIATILGSDTKAVSQAMSGQSVTITVNTRTGARPFTTTSGDADFKALLAENFK